MKLKENREMKLNRAFTFSGFYLYTNKQNEKYKNEHRKKIK